jgi:hypothetical protein
MAPDQNMPPSAPDMPMVYRRLRSSPPAPVLLFDAGL